MSNKKNVGVIIPLCLLLSACGGGSGSGDTAEEQSVVVETSQPPVVNSSDTDTSTTPVDDSSDTATPTTPVDDSVDTDTPTTPVDDNIGTNTPTTPVDDGNSTDTAIDNTTCTDISGLTITASDDGAFDSTFSPANAIDQNVADTSRWSNLGLGKTLTLDFGQSAVISNVAILWYKASERTSTFSIETSNDNTNWTNVLTSTTSSISNSQFELYDLTPTTARYLRLIGEGNSESEWNSVIELVTNHCGDVNELDQAFQNDSSINYEGTGILPPVKPVLDENSIPHSIELIDWYLNTPEADLNDADLDSLRIDEDDLAAGYQDDDYFYPSADGGLIFRATVGGAKTSVNTSFVRTELREMLRRGNTSIKTQGINGNNWVFGSATTDQQNNAAGIDGKLSATLAVNYVTVTGDANQVGRVIIGQIHANDDEPIRLYYRKLPGNTNGSIYFAHEPLQRDDEYVEMIGTRSQSASNPADGIALNEKFSYTIEVVDNQLEVVISRDGKPDVTGSYDMSNSGYYPSIDGEEQYMYFKAGVYNQNNTGLDFDYVQATFYDITNTHTNYNP